MPQQCHKNIKNLHLIFRTLTTYKRGEYGFAKSIRNYFPQNTKQTENSIFNIAAHLKFTMYQVHCSNYIVSFAESKAWIYKFKQSSWKQATTSQNINHHSEKNINQNFKTNLKMHPNMNQSAKNILEARLANNYTCHW